MAQSVGMDYIGPFTFNAARFLIGGTVLLPPIWYRSKRVPEIREKSLKKITLAGGVCCGAALCSASLFQQIGIQYTTVGKAGFITTLYITTVPVIGLLFGRRNPGKVWVGAVMAVFGLYLLCVNES